MLLNCGVGEDSWKSLGRKGDQNQSILKAINPEYSLEGLMLKLKLQHFGHLMWRTDSLEKTLMLGKTEGRRGLWGWDSGMSLPTQWMRVWANSGEDRAAWREAGHRVSKTWRRLSNWTTATGTGFYKHQCNLSFPHCWAHSARKGCSEIVEDLSNIGWDEFNRTLKCSVEKYS